MPGLGTPENCGCPGPGTGRAWHQGTGSFATGVCGERDAGTPEPDRAAGAAEPRRPGRVTAAPPPLTAH